VVASSRALSVILTLLLVTANVAWAQEIPDGQPSGDTQQVATHAGPDSLYPDPTLTPGASFDGVTADQICLPGYARSVRDVTTAERAQVYTQYGATDVRGADEVDHFIPLELGGSNAIANLWPEPFGAPGAHEKDRVENYLHDQVCSGALALGDAQQMIVGDWYAIYLTLSVATALPDTSSSPGSALTPDVSGSALTQTMPGLVSFASVTGGPPGGLASVAVQSAPGTTCSIQYVTPAGSKSTAKGQGAGVFKTIGQDGSASWSWDIGPSTRPGTGSVTATCSTGTVTAPITIG
jgi:hypothetical protein